MICVTSFLDIKTTESGKVLNWDSIVERVKQPRVLNLTQSDFAAMSEEEKAALKRNQENIILSAATKRSKEGVEKKGLTAIGLDFDSGEMGIEEVAVVLTGLGISHYVIYSTISHSLGRPRFRALIPFSECVTPQRWQLIADYLHDIIFPAADKSGKKTAQAWFLPVTFEGEDVYEQRVAIGKPLVVADECPLYKAATAYHQSLATFKEERDSRGQSLIDSPISFFNKNEPLENRLRDYGYKKVGPNRYLHPKSESGLAGVTILGEGNICYSHHESDELYGKVCDAFELYAWYECDRDKSKAAREILSHIKAYQQLQTGNTTSNSARSLDCSWGSEGINLKLDWLIKGLIQPSTFNVIYGKSGSFKSFLALDLAFSVSTGEPWHGHKTKQGIVVYIAAEGAQGVKKRIRAREVVDNRRFVNLGVSSVTLFLDKESDAKWIADELLKIERERNDKVVLVVFDTLARCYSGDENSNSDMSRFVSGADHIIEQTGAAILVVHHSGKDEDRGARGASSLFAAADSVFKVKRDNKTQTVTLTNPKQKDADECAAKTLILREVELDERDEDDEAVTSLVIDHVSVACPLRNANDEKKANERRWIVEQVESKSSANRLGLRSQFIDTFDDERKVDSRRSAFDKHLKSLLEDERLDQVGDMLYPVTHD